jgi:uncharacterized protein YecA (UPF0149 family)
VAARPPWGRCATARPKLGFQATERAVPGLAEGWRPAKPAGADGSSMWSASRTNGFLAGIAAGPELITPSEWLPVVWGGGEAAFESVEEASRVLGC